MYLSSKHQSTGDLGGMRYPNRFLTICSSVHAIIHFKKLNHRVNFGQFKLCTDMELCTDIEKNPGPLVYVDATKTIHAPCLFNMSRKCYSI